MKDPFRKKILIIEAWGLNSDPQLAALLVSKNCKVTNYNLDSAQEPPKLSDYDLVLSSGALGNSITDGLLTLRLSLQLNRWMTKDEFTPKANARIYAFGKAALAFLYTGFFGDFSNKTLKFKPILLKDCWRKCIAAEFSKEPIWGAQICQDPWDHTSEFFEGLAPWATAMGVPCAWKTNDNLFYFSDVDILALKEASLLPDYGYFDSSLVSTVDQFLDKLLE